MYTQEDLKNLSAEEKTRKKHSIEMELVILESDAKKMVSQKTALEAQIRKLHYDEERIRIALEENKKELALVSSKLVQNEEDLKRLKKQRNLIN